MSPADRRFSRGAPLPRPHTVVCGCRADRLQPLYHRIRTPTHDGDCGLGSCYLSLKYGFAGSGRDPACAVLCAPHAAFGFAAHGASAIAPCGMCCGRRVRGQRLCGTIWLLLLLSEPPIPVPADAPWRRRIEMHARQDIPPNTRQDLERRRFERRARISSRML